MIDLVSSIKNNLMNGYDVCILDDMKDPIGCNIINGKKTMFQAHSEFFPNTMTSWDIVKKIVGNDEHMTFKSDITHFAFYNIVTEDDGYQIRYAGVRVE